MSSQNDAAPSIPDQPTVDASLVDERLVRWYFLAALTYMGLSMLSPGESEVIRLKHFAQMTFEEIAERLGISANTAKTRYYRGLERLRGWLDSDRD